MDLHGQICGDAGAISCGGGEQSELFPDAGLCWKSDQPGFEPSGGTGELERRDELLRVAHAIRPGGGRVPSGWGYRLPTEAEREYACRAGTTTAFHFGSAIHGGMANFYDYYEYDAAIGDIYVANPSVPCLPRTTTVGSYAPNAFGLYDMHGNVWEWCQDWYGSYPTGSVTDPQGPASGSDRVGRGGGWNWSGRGCRSAVRCSYGSSRSTGATAT